MQDLNLGVAATVEVGPILKEDGTADTTTELTNADFLLCKNGAASALNTTATAASLVANDLQGTRLVVLDTTDTGTLGRLKVWVKKAGLASPLMEFVVRPALWFANVVAGTGGTIPGVVAGGKGGLPVTDAGTGLILTGYGAGAVTATLSPATLIAISQAASRGADVYYVTKAGNDGSGAKNRPDLPYLTIGAAVTAATAGDTLVIGEGAFSEYIDTAKRLRVFGAGHKQTIVTSTHAGASSDGTWTTTDGMVFEDITIANTDVGNAFGFEAGGTQWIVARRCRLVGKNDTLMHASGGTIRIDLYDCDIESTYDTIFVAGAGTLEVNLYNCRTRATAAGANDAHALRCETSGSVFRVYGGLVKTGGGLSENHGVRTVAGSTVILAGGAVVETSGTGAVDLNQSAGGTIIVAEAKYTTFSGTITHVEPGASILEDTADVQPKVSTLATDYTTARAAKIDYLDMKISDVEAAVVEATMSDRAADTVTLTTGTPIAGTVLNSHTHDGTFYTTAPVTPAVGGFGLNEYFEFSVLPAQTAPKLHFWGWFENGTPPNTRVARLAAWNWTISEWQFVSTGATDLDHATSEVERLLEINVAHRSETGVIRLRVTSDSTETSDRLYIDQLVLHVSASTSTPGQIAGAVWSATTRTLSSFGTLVADMATAVVAAVQDVGTYLARLIGLVEDEAGDRFTAKALEQAPSPPVELTQDDIDAIVAGLVSGGVAKETTLTAIKGAGWTTETLKALAVYLAAIVARTNLIGAVKMEVTSPNNTGDDIDIVYGSTYAVGPPDRRIPIVITDATLPDVSSATVACKIARKTEWDRLGKDATWAAFGTPVFISQADGVVTYKLALAATDTARAAHPPLDLDAWVYHLRISSGTDTITDRIGSVNITASSG